MFCDKLCVSDLNRSGLEETHVIFSFEVIVKKEKWKISGNMTFELAMNFYSPKYGRIFLNLDFQTIKYVFD